MSNYNVDEITRAELSHLSDCEKALLDIRESVLGFFEKNNEPLYDKWLGACVARPGEIPGAVEDLIKLSKEGE